MRLSVTAASLPLRERKLVRAILLAIMFASSSNIPVFAHAAGASMRASAIPQFTASVRCPGDGSPAGAGACDFLRQLGIDELEVPPGGRIYRETWLGPFRGRMHSGSIVLTIHADGRRTLKTPWRRSVYRLKPGELTGFERALAQSDFGTLPVFNGLDEICVDGVGTSLEAIVDGRYRLVYFDYCGGVQSESVAEALDQLFVFAAGKSGLQYPVNPKHPTFRG